MSEAMRAGAVDLGSNSFHLVIAQQSQGRIQVLDRMKERVRLGEGIARDGSLQADARDRALRCLELFGQGLSAIDSDRIRAVGTKAFRDLRRNPSFHQDAESALGHPIEVVPGEEEARLIYLGVREREGGSGGRVLIIDIGGGSTELVAGQHAEPTLAESLSMGSGTYSRRFFADGALKKKNFERAVLRARNQVNPIRRALRSHGWDRAIGTSGTHLALGKILAENAWAAGKVTRTGLQALQKHLCDFGTLEGLELKGLKEGRRLVLPGGLAIAQGVLEELNIEQLELSEAALREGLMVDLFGRLREADIRPESVRHLGERFHIDAAQSARVVETAESIFSQVRKQWQLSRKRDLPFLRWAAAIHEIGLSISHTGYHRHGAYLIEHSDPPGFSRQETQLLGELVRFHRRRVDANAGERFPAALRTRFFRLLMILRIAIRMHRSRTDENLPQLAFRAVDQRLEVQGESGWQNDFALVADNLQAEARAWRNHAIDLSV